MLPSSTTQHNPNCPEQAGNTSQNTEGLNELLFKGTIEFSIVTEKDVNYYFLIFYELSYNPRRSNRIKEIREKFPDISNSYPLSIFKQLHENGIKTFPGSGLDCEVPHQRCSFGIIDLTNKIPIQLFHELSLLLAVKQAGNINTLGKASIILDHLKNMKSISEKK